MPEQETKHQRVLTQIEQDLAEYLENADSLDKSGNLGGMLRLLREEIDGLYSAGKYLKEAVHPYLSVLILKELREIRKTLKEVHSLLSRHRTPSRWNSIW